MKKAKLTFFLGSLLILFTNPVFSQSDNMQDDFQFEVPSHIQSLNEQIRWAENSEDWDSYYRLREEIIQEWRKVNPEVANLYKTVSGGTPDLTPDGMPADHKKENINESNESILFETPALPNSLWGDDVLVTGGRAYDISMDISRNGEMYIAVSGRLNGTTTRDSLYIYKSVDGGQSWIMWNSLGTTTQTFSKIELMCFDGQVGSTTQDSYILLFYLFDNGWLRVGRTETDSVSWSFYTIVGSSGGGPVTDFAVDRNASATNYRAICMYDSSNFVKTIRSEPSSYGTVWQDVYSFGQVGRDLAFCYGWNGAVYASYNGLNTGNLYVRENTNYADPASWGSGVTLLTGSTDTTRHGQIIASRDNAPNNIVSLIFERKSSNTYQLREIIKPSGDTWGSMQNWVAPEENKYPSLYSRKVSGNRVFRGVFHRSASGNLPPRSVRYKSYDGTSWTNSTQTSNNDATGLYKAEVGDIDGNTPVFAYGGANYLGVYFNNSSWTSTGINETEITPGVYSLEQNYPNPFNPSTFISFRIPENSFVTIKVYNALGKEVSSLLEDELSAGYHTINWEAVNSSGNLLPSGVYFIRMTAGNYSHTIKAALLK
jgi:hypothetical protein